MGIVLLILGFFIWFQTNKIVSESQNMYRIDVNLGDVLKNIFDLAIPLEAIGFFVFLFGLSLSIFGVGMIIIDKRQK